MSSPNKEVGVFYHRYQDDDIYAFLSPLYLPSEERVILSNNLSSYLDFWHSLSEESEWKMYILSISDIIFTQFEKTIEQSVKIELDSLLEIISQDPLLSKNNDFPASKLEKCKIVYDHYPENFGIELHREILSFFVFYVPISESLPNRLSKHNLDDYSVEYFVDLTQDIEIYADKIAELASKTIAMRVVNFTLTDSTATLPTASEVGLRGSKIILGDSEWMISTRLIGMGYDAQNHSSEWTIRPDIVEKDLADFPTFYSEDTKGSLRARFFVVGDTKNSTELGTTNSDTPFDADAASKVLQRWGPIHAKLYLAITLYLTKANGIESEVDEDSLLKASGLESAVKNGNIDRMAAIQKIEDALRDLKNLHVSVVSEDGKYATGRFPVYQIEPLRIRHRIDSRNYVTFHVRFAPGLWARDLFKIQGGSRALLISPKVLDIPYKRYPLAALIALWVSFNSYIFTSRNTITVKKILKSVLPDSIPHSNWEGLEITWQLLNPDLYLTTKGKNARTSIRRQINSLPKLLAKYGISIKLSSDALHMNSSWDDFLNTTMDVKISKPLTLPKRPKKTAKPRISDQDLIELDELRELMKAARLSQVDIGKHLRVSQPTVSNWLRGHIRLPQAEKLAIQELCKEKLRP